MDRSGALWYKRQPNLTNVQKRRGGKPRFFRQFGVTPGPVVSPQGDFRPPFKMRERIPLQNRLRLPLLCLSLAALLVLILTKGYRIPAPPWFEEFVTSLLNVVMVLFLADLSLNLLLEPDRRAWARSRVPDLLLVVPVLYCLFNAHPQAGGAMVILRESFVLYRLTEGTRAFRQLLLALQVRPARQVALAFLLCILAGTYLLTIPAATADGRGAPFLDALFTSTAAVCVTGLTVVDTGSFYTPFGQSVVLVLIQMGGLGIMTLSTSIALLFKRKLGIRTRALMHDLKGEASLQNLTSVIFYIVRVALAIEAAGAVLLYLRWRRDFLTEGEALFSSVFHSVSAFCNAGFSLFSTSLTHYRGDLAVNLTVTGLIILGGLGFTTLAAFINAGLWRRGWRDTLNRMPTHSKLALVATSFLLVAGTLYIFFFEFDGTLGPLGMKEKLLASWFQSATLRTGGFHTVDLASFQNVTLWLMLIWMFVGGCPSSTAGGIKATTAGILVLAVRSMLLGREDVELFGRSIPKNVVYKSIAIVIISLLLVTLCFSLLLVTQAGSFVGLLFETVSAFANVGLSLGITPTLGAAGKMIIIFLMYAGRIGPLTLALAVGEQAARASFHYPEARILVG
jgi:trk/ktr system potassium uptake protein